ncbi:transposase [Amycolatopsis carbonis]|uniref:Transposase n=1 Tax=Amycolatopsis carbonis TaxID=715471 RepID=A0A9Y2MPZ2_9PSEU|nr:transposase [Amycolatopsis sp. 2-15]WIX76615.1 transposase [Amycolatopsis sp. 2-15]
MSPTPPTTSGPGPASAADDNTKPGSATTNDAATHSPNCRCSTRACLAKAALCCWDAAGRVAVQLLSDDQWALVEDLLPVRAGRQGRPFSDARSMVEGIIYRYRCGIAWRDVPAVFGSWRRIWTWHRRTAGNDTWDTVLQRLLAAADAAGLVEWAVSVGSTIARAHQHATNFTGSTGGWVELHGSAPRAA